MSAKPRVCVIGAGISGLVAAYLLAEGEQIEVDLIETEARLGGASYTMDVVLPDGTLRWVDMGVNDFNASTYEQLVAMMELVTGVGYKELIDEASFSRANGEEAYILDAKGLHDPDGIPTDLDGDFRHFKEHASTDAGKWAKKLTVAEYLEQAGTTKTKGDRQYHADFGRLCIFPRVNGMYFSTDKDPQSVPLVAVMHYYGLQEGYRGDGLPAKRMYWVGGTRQWIGALEDQVRDRGVTIMTQVSATVARDPLRTATPVVTLTGRRGGREDATQMYDAVVFAGHAQTALKCLRTLTGKQKATLEEFTYLPSTAYAHTDTALLPPRLFWRTYNILIHETDQRFTPYTISYVVNFHQNDAANPEYQNIEKPLLFFCTLNPHREIPEHEILRQPNDEPAIARFPHNVVNNKALTAQRAVWGEAWPEPHRALTSVLEEELPPRDKWGIQGLGNVFFTGGWTLGAGLHEQCLMSAAKVNRMVRKAIEHKATTADGPA
jgi:predicted NAD/FAD-binding protein